MKLNEIQVKTLWKMTDNREYSAYLLGVSISTMFSLQRKNLIKRNSNNMVNTPGYERYNFLFKITAYGLEVLKNDY